MPPFKVNDQELIDALLAVFRKEGFEGASMSILSRETGLKRSSLYHRFPGGKQQMAEEVLAHTGKWIQQHIISPLEEKGNPRDRLKSVLTHISLLYGGGRKTCILRSLSMGTTSQPFTEDIKTRFTAWIEAFANFGNSLGMPNEEAKSVALQTVIEIQGALVLAQALHDPQIFQDRLHQIEQTYNLHIS